jgi:hypothetical protein
MEARESLSISIDKDLRPKTTLYCLMVGSPYGGTGIDRRTEKPVGLCSPLGLPWNDGSSGAWCDS